MQRKIDSEEFVRIAEKALAAGDVELLSRSVTYRWQPRQVASLLKHPDVMVRRLAAVTIGVVGNITCIPSLTHALRDSDSDVNQMAEHSLWTIWLRAGTPESLKSFKLAMAMLGEDQYRPAANHFLQTIKIDPGFAEAYNQAAIAYYLMSKYRLALKYWRKTIDLMPMHFGAIAGMGHCYMHIDRPTAAVRCYQHALRINPHMKAIRKALTSLQCKAVDISGQTGAFELHI